jgi:hypothetical protein
MATEFCTKGQLIRTKKEKPGKIPGFLVGEAWRLGAKPQF